MREQLYRMKHYPVQEQAHTRFCGATSTIIEVLDKSEKFQAFWRFTQRGNTCTTRSRKGKAPREQLGALLINKINQML
jgi:hypothetical protein